MPSEAYHYRRLYEAAVEHIEALNQWAAERGIVLPDTETAGSEMSGYAVVSHVKYPDGSAVPSVEFTGEVFESLADAEAARRRFLVLHGDAPFLASVHTAAVVLLPEEA